MTRLPLIPADSKTQTLAFQLKGECVAPAVAQHNLDALSDGTGHVILDINDWLDPETKACALGVELRIETHGTWDPAFDTDSSTDVFLGLQRRDFAVTFNP